jgi:hypothetical protein
MEDPRSSLGRDPALHYVARVPLTKLESIDVLRPVCVSCPRTHCSVEKLNRNSVCDQQAPLDPLRAAGVRPPER